MPLVTAAGGVAEGTARASSQTTSGGATRSSAAALPSQTVTQTRPALATRERPTNPGSRRGPMPKMSSVTNPAPSAWRSMSAGSSGPPPSASAPPSSRSAPATASQA